MKKQIEEKPCLNCTDMIKPKTPLHKFCCVPCRVKYYSIHNQKIPNPIKDLNKNCSEKSCKKKARGILNKKFYCKKHYSELKQNPGVRQYYRPKLLTS